MWTASASVMEKGMQAYLDYDRKSCKKYQNQTGAIRRGIGMATVLV